VVSREEILDGIRGTDFVAESNIVDRHIRSLRIKLRDDYRHPRFIATVPREGYRFIPTFSNLGWAGGRKAHAQLSAAAELPGSSIAGRPRKRQRVTAPRRDDRPS
jgi:DNA-binding winged helix-turn-helix (wHTH) protein